MLEALGNLGDFIGGIAVVVTLVYLAIQVRQNTRQLGESARLARSQARDVAFHSFSEFRSKVVCNADVAELYLSGLRDPDSLESADRLRFNLLANELFYILQTSTDRVSEVRGGSVDDTLRELRIDSILRSPGMAKWWRQNRDGFRPDFASRIDSVFAGRESTG